MHYLFKNILFAILITGWYPQTTPLFVDHLVVLYDAGETTSLTPVLTRWEKEGKDFRVLVMGTAETLVKPEMFGEKRVTLKDLGIDEIVNTETKRTKGLSATALDKIKKSIQPRKLIVGTASKIQEQIILGYPEAITVAFLDNFNYDPNSEFYQTVYKVQAVAKHVFCPSQNVMDMFEKNTLVSKKPVYHIVGKPSFEVWKKEVKEANKETVKKILELTKKNAPIVTFIGGYGPGYEIVNPLFQSCEEKLEEDGFQPIIIRHPKIAPQKVKITEALAISDYVVGYNSSVVFEAALIGKNAVFLIPPGAPYQHFAIDQRMMTQVTSYEELKDYIQKRKKPNMWYALNIPKNSLDLISTLIDQL